MNILIAGLGLIGGSFAKVFNKRHTIYGFDKKDVLDLAIKDKIIAFKFNENINDNENINNNENINDNEDINNNENINNNISADNINIDIVIVSLPPKLTVEFINKYKFSKKTIVCDMCGVKKYILDNVDINTNYVGCHPMAGKEVSGIENSSKNLFDNASLIIAIDKRTNLKSVEILKNLFKEANFSRFIECDANFHDREIAYTSQLAHIVSNAYVKSPAYKDYVGFTGGSFQDMTRIASLNENIWSELFLFNKENILTELNLLIDNLKVYSEAIEARDEKTLKNLLREGSVIKNEK